MSDIIKRDKIYSGRKLELVKDTITLSNGKEVVRELVVHNGASAMIPIDDEGNIIFVRQYRHAAQQEILEIPAGTLEKGEDPLECAKRELEEETSYRCENITFIIKMYSAIGICNEVIYIYLCENLIKGEFNFDDDEYITLERYSLEEAFAKIKTGEICDSKTIVSLYAYRDYLLSK